MKLAYIEFFDITRLKVRAFRPLQLGEGPEGTLRPIPKNCGGLESDPNGTYEPPPESL
jgi:hypothetical protein